MLQDERDVARCVQVGDELHVMAQAVIGQFLKLGRRERVRFYQGGSARVLEVALQLEGEAVHLEERRLPDGLLQDVDAVEMMRVVPVKLAHLKVGPIFDFAFGEQEDAVARLQQLYESHDAVVQAGRRVGGDRHPIAAQFHLVCLLRQRIAVAILRLADSGGIRGDYEAQRACRAAGIREFQVKAAIEFVVEDFEGRIAGRDSFTHHTPVARKCEFRCAEANDLRLRHHDVSPGEQRRYRVRPRRGKE